MQQVSDAVNTSLSLSGLPLDTEYRSDTHDLIRDFYLPCLERSSLYFRAVGYFTSQGLSVAAQGITALINGDGRMRLVASPLFDADDLEAIEKGYIARGDALERSLLRQIEATADSIASDRLGYLSWLIAEGRLEVRIAVPQDDNGNPCRGIYHEKLGVFSDDHGDSVAFTGSPNETAGGLVDNFESTDVFCSWREPQRVEKKLANFERLWNNETPRLSVTAFPDAARQQLLRYRPKSRPVSEASPWLSRTPVVPDLPPELWEHQVEAIRAWERHGRRGLLSMATGSGKTRTALAAAERRPNLGLLVIAVPRAALVEQWSDELQDHTSFPRPILVYESAARWQESLFHRLRHARKSTEDSPVIVTGTLHSLSGKRFESVLRDSGFTGKALLIADEVHNAGAPTYRAVLRDSFGWRLGLSATPARHFDEEGTNFIAEYFGSTVYTYDMKRALEDGRLCPYRYYVIPAHLNDDEYNEYLRLTQQIIQLRSSQSEELSYRTDNRLDGDGKDVERLLFQRARILKKCNSKLNTLENALDAHPFQRGLIYCADNDQLNDVTAVLRRREEIHLTYTAPTSNAESSCAVNGLPKTVN